MRMEYRILTPDTRYTSMQHAFQPIVAAAAAAVAVLQSLFTVEVLLVTTAIVQEAAYDN